MAIDKCLLFMSYLRIVVCNISSFAEHSAFHSFNSWINFDSYSNFISLRAGDLKRSFSINEDKQEQKEIIKIYKFRGL